MSFLSILALEEISKPFILHTDITRVIYAYKPANRHRDVRTTCRSPIQTHDDSESWFEIRSVLVFHHVLWGPWTILARPDLLPVPIHNYDPLNLLELHFITLDRFSLNVNSIAPSFFDWCPSQATTKMSELTNLTRDARTGACRMTGRGK